MSGRTVLVTGASAGLGLAIAQQLSRLGARVVLTSRDVDRLKQARSSLSPADHRIEPLDLANSDAIAPWLRGVAERNGRLDGVVHSAGRMITRPLRMLSAADWDSAMGVNVAAASALAKGFRQQGVRAEKGSIVFIASVTGLVGQAAQSLYGATKGALIAMTRALAVELARENIRVNCVAPAVIESGMSLQIKASVTPEQWQQIAAQHPLGLGRPEDVAHAVSFLLADTARWITGTTLVVDGGYTAQ